MSRPWASVPKGNVQSGGSSAFIRLASSTGSVSVIHGASTATTMATATSPPPIHRLAPSFTLISTVADARIDRDIGEIDQHVDDEEEDHDQQDTALDRGNVALEHRVDQERADAGPGEELFDNHRLPHQRTELQADRGDDEDERVAHDVPTHDAPLAHALAAGGADEIGVQHVEHGGTRGARQQGHRTDAERDGGQSEIAQAAIAIAEARKPFELQREEIHQQQAKPEFGQREP